MDLLSLVWNTLFSHKIAPSPPKKNVNQTILMVSLSKVGGLSSQTVYIKISSDHPISFLLCPASTASTPTMEALHMAI